MRLYLLIIIFSFCGVFLVYADTLPDWITKPQLNCKITEICAVGIGTGVTLASVDARNNILKQFETKIESKFKSNIKDNNKNIQENIFDEIEEETSGIINGVNIKELFMGDDNVYAFATLNKNQAAGVLEKKIDEIDIKMKFLFEDKMSSNFKKLEKLQKERNKLNQYHKFLQQTDIKEAVTMSDILKKKKNILPKKYFINITGEDKIGIASILNEYITENGDKIVNQFKESNTILNVKIALNRQYLNIDGFEKYKIDVIIECKKDNLIVSSFDVSITESGRSEEQIYEKIIKQIKISVEQNIDNLIL